MKRILPLLAAGLFGALFASAAIYWDLRTEAAQAAAPSPAGQGSPHAAGPRDGAGTAAGPTQRVLFHVDGISCGSCEGKIRKALKAKPGVVAVAVNLDERAVTVDYESGVADPKALAETITRAGFPARYVASGPEATTLPKTTDPKARGCGGRCCAEKS
ncbi:MAG: heavy-metal-associated domain-containing protein [Deltaproteobacteria bacterium]|nr:heavy-metal-associated domain-containing protein [Deltaproteobacteria bacterium]